MMPRGVYPSLRQILLSSVAKTITLTEKMAKNTNTKIAEILFLALQYHKMVQKAPTSSLLLKKSNFKWLLIFKFWIAYPRANHTTLN